MDKKTLIIGGLVIILIFTLLLLSGKKTQQVDILQVENALLEKKIAEAQDSIELLHKYAVQIQKTDTIYVEKIKILKQKTNVEISNIPHLTVDSNINLFTRLSEEFISGLSVDSI